MSQRFLKNTSATLEVTFYVDGTGTDADGAVTLTVTDAADTTVVDEQETTSVGSGVYTYILDPQTAVKQLTCVWTGTFSSVEQSVTTYAEVVGAHLFTETDARAFNAVGGSSNAPLGNATKYPDADIARTRDEVTDLLEEWTGISWIPRYHREVTAGYGTRTFWPEKQHVNSLISATIQGTAANTSNITIVDGRALHRSDGLWPLASNTYPAPVVVEYEHGKSPSDDVRRIALKLAIEKLVPTTMGDAYAFDPDGSARPVLEGGRYGNVSKHADVNAWVRQHDHRSMV